MQQDAFDAKDDTPLSYPPENASDVTLDPHHTHFLLVDDGPHGNAVRKLIMKDIFESTTKSLNCKSLCLNSFLSA